MSNRAFLSKTQAFNRLKQGQRVVKRKSRSGRTVYILRKCKHFNTKKSSTKGKKHGSRHIHRHLRK